MHQKILGVFLSLGESFTDLKKKGQDSLMLAQNIATFSKHFDKVFVFTYEHERVKLPPNAVLVTPPFKLHRYLYGLFLPLIHAKTLRRCQLLRCFQLSGTLPALVAKLIYRKKFVFNFGYDYTAFAKIEGKSIQSWFFSLLEPWSLKLADHIIVKNKALLKHAPKQKTSYIPNGVDINKFRPAKKQHTNMLKILYVGRLEPQKNLTSLIKAVSLLKIDVEIKIVGSGSQAKTLAKLTRQLSVKAQIISRVAHAVIPKVYQQADVFVLPSIKEGSPKVLLEAMAVGVACIASDIPEHREIISSGKNGILVTPSPDQLTGAIKKLRSRGLRKSIGTAARKTVKSHFDSKALMNQEVALLKAL